MSPSHFELELVTERHPEESRATSTLMERQRGDDKGDCTFVISTPASVDFSVLECFCFNVS